MILKFESVAELREFLDFAEELGRRPVPREYETDNRDSYRDAAPTVYAGKVGARITPANLGVGYGGKPQGAEPRGEAVEAAQDTRTVEDAAPAAAPEVDANGVRYDARIHAPSRSLNADGTWRAKRKVSPELVAQVLAEQQSEGAAEEPQADEAGDDVLVTETHALPADEGGEAEADAEPSDEAGEASQPDAAGAAVEGPAGMSIDFPALVASAQVLAEDLDGDMVKVLGISKTFLAATSSEAFAALKSHVAPDGNGGGKSLPTMTPGERRVLEAAMTLHLAPDATAE